MKTIRELKEWISNGGKTAIFCAGKNGYTFYKILQLLDIEIDYIIDNDSQKWNKKVFQNKVCSSSELLRKYENSLSFLICHYNSLD